MKVYGYGEPIDRPWQGGIMKPRYFVVPACGEPFFVDAVTLMVLRDYRPGRDCMSAKELQAKGRLCSDALHRRVFDMHGVFELPEGL